MLVAGLTAVAKTVLTERGRASPVRTLPTASTTWLFAAAFAAVVGIGLKLFCAVTAKSASRQILSTAPRKLVRDPGGQHRDERDQREADPQRTASTASALMIGLALVTLVAVLAAGITKASAAPSTSSGRRLRDHRAEQLLADPDAAADAAAKSRASTAVANVRAGDAAAFGQTFSATAVNPGAGRSSTLDWSRASAGDSPARPDGAFVDEGYAKSHTSASARRSTLTTPQGGRWTSS